MKRWNMASYKYLRAKVGISQFINHSVISMECRYYYYIGTTAQQSQPAHMGVLAMKWYVACSHSYINYALYSPL